MSEITELLVRCILEVLAEVDKPSTESMLQMHVETRLGQHFTVSQILEAIQFADKEGYVTGLPGQFNRIRWSITDAGRHFIAQLGAA
jgi:hypothetical protein